MNYQSPYYSNTTQNQNQYSQGGGIGSQVPQFGQQYQQPLFPQPTGNVYNINNTLEVANVPAGVGLSVALCLPENLMYLKTMQNGTPMFWAYKIAPYDNKTESKDLQETDSAAIATDLSKNQKVLLEEIQSYKVKVDSLEKQINLMKKELGGLKNDDF